VQQQVWLWPTHPLSCPQELKAACQWSSLRRPGRVKITGTGKLNFVIRCFSGCTLCCTCHLCNKLQRLQQHPASAICCILHQQYVASYISNALHPASAMRCILHLGCYIYDIGCNVIYPTSAICCILHQQCVASCISNALHPASAMRYIWYRMQCYI
jgi:hypothetical protein